MGRKIVIICVDGFGPECLAATATPTLDRMAQAGVSVVGRSVIPSLTNVNNASIITGTPPCCHGITANYCFDPATGREMVMESPEFVMQPTILERAQEAGKSTALLTTKNKLLPMLQVGAEYCCTAESPDAEMIEKVGPAEEIYSAAINHWLFRALRVVLRQRDPDVVYCSTTDFIMHKYAPQDEQSLQHVAGMDAILGEILNDNSNREIYLTADHGMNHKSHGLDLEKILASGPIAARAIPLIRDRYTAHHEGLGGVAYVYLDEPACIDDAMGLLRETPGIDEVYPRQEATKEFDLLAERIGNIMVLGDKDTVFGTFDTIHAQVNLRSHGSRHESAVPIIAYGAPVKQDYRNNYDLVAQLGSLGGS